MGTSSKSSKVRKSGQRKKNKLHDGIFAVTNVDINGAPDEPEGINAKWRNDCGTLVREKVRITYENWHHVPTEKKNELWEVIKAKYIFPPEFLERGEKATLYTMGRALRTFRANLNKDYVKKGLTPFNDFGFITPDDWNTFVNQRTSKKALEVSQNFKTLSSKRKWHPNLGPGGYKAKVKKWRLKEQQDREAGRPDVLEGCSERTRNWVLGRSKSTDDGQLIPKDSEVSEVLQRVKNIVVMEKEGRFKPNRQNDQLTAALGNEEHRGRTRGVSSKASWKEGFPEDAGSYKKRDHPDTDEEHEKWKQNFFQFMKENPHFAQPFTVPEIRLSTDSEQQTCTQPLHLSSAGSTPASTHKYPVDSITEDTPCSLHVPIGKKGRATIKVAEGIAMVGRTFHTAPIPPECAKVQVIRVVDDQYLNNDLDYPVEDEGIETLGEAVNNFILWHRRDIILHEKVAQPPPTHDKEAGGDDDSCLPPPHDKEAPTDLGSSVPPPPPPRPPPTHEEQAGGVTGSPLPSQTHELEASTASPPSPMKHSSTSSKTIGKSLILIRNLIAIMIEILTICSVVERYLEGMKQSYICQKKEVVAKKPVAKDGVPEGSWDLEDDDFPNYRHGMPLLPRDKIAGREWILKRFHGWYMEACSRGIQFIQAKVPGDLFNWTPFDLHVPFEDIHALYRFDKMDATMITIWCL